jgi:hypothetical protein
MIQKQHCATESALYIDRGQHNRALSTGIKTSSLRPTMEVRMPSMPLKPVPPKQVRRIAGLPPVKEIKATFPKRAHGGPTEARAALKRWQNSVESPPVKPNPEIRFTAVRPSTAAFRKLRTIVKSEAAPVEILKQRMQIETFFGTLFSGLATYEFLKLEAEYRRRKARRTDLGATEARWREIIADFSKAFAAAGIPNVDETTLRKFARELNASPANRDTIIELANKATAVGRPEAISANTTITASFVPDVGRVIDTGLLGTVIKDLCDTPISQGSFTKHFSKSVALSVKIKYPCGIGWGGIKWCTKTVTVAGVSFSLSVDVGYKVTCCGATAWGQSAAQVCATIVSIKVCATCTATVTGVAGVSRTPVASGCSYGLGINATLKCALAGQTILSVAYPFGWTITGPCPPAGLCA